MDYVDLALVLAFVDRTVARGAPVRVAISRAAKHYSLPRDWVLAAYRTSNEALS